MLHIDCILAPTDFSDPASRALEHARELARSHEAHLHVLHVLEAPSFPGFYGTGAVALYGERPDLRQRAEEAIANLIPSRVHAAVTTHVVEGKAGEEVVAFAAEHDVDVVVMASQGRSGMKRVLIGSVAGYVVRHASCPIFIVKADGKMLTGAAPDASDA